MAESKEERNERLFRQMAALCEGAYVQEQPFVSETPIVGRLIVLVREMWNSVAAKWYVRPMLRQQNDFNQLVIQMLYALLQGQVEMFRRLDEIEGWIIDSDRDGVSLARKVAEGECRLRQSYRQATQDLAELAHRLSEFEAVRATRFQAKDMDKSGGGGQG